jgi:hypothetical protein
MGIKCPRVKSVSILNYTTANEKVLLASLLAIRTAKLFPQYELAKQMSTTR